MTGDKKEQRNIVISISICAFIIVLSDYILNISLPTIARQFNVNTGKVSWLVLIYLLVLSSTMLIFGRLSDKTGLKKMHMLGYVIFILGSLAGAIAPNLNLLIISRAMQGIGGSMLYVTCFSMIPKYLPPESTGWAFGIISTVISAGLVIGVPLGGFLTGLLSWRYIFIFNVVVCLFGVLMAARVLPGEKTVPWKLKGFDSLGGTLCVMSLSSLVFGISMIPSGTGAVLFSVFAFSLVTFILFFLWERKCSEPLVDLELIQNRKFVYAILSTFMAMAFIGGHNFLFPFYLEQVKGLDTEHAGLFIMIYSIVFVCISPFAGKASARINPLHLCVSGMISALGACLMFVFFIKLSPWFSLIAFLIWLAVSYALFIAPNNNQVMQMAPPEKTGSASGIFTTLSTLGLVMGVCLFEVIFSHSQSADTASFNTLYLTAQQHITGFRNAYLWGCCFLAGAILFSLAAILVNKKQVSATGTPP